LESGQWSHARSDLASGNRRSHEDLDPQAACLVHSSQRVQLVNRAQPTQQEEKMITLNVNGGEDHQLDVNPRIRRAIHEAAKALA
jgi:hypothetical protein